MKNIFALMVGLVTSVAITAGPVGTPAAPMMYEDGVYMSGNSDYSVRIGYMGDFVFDRKMQNKNNDRHIVDDMDIISNYGEITLNLFDRVDLFARLGTGHFTQSYRYRESGTGANNEVDIYSESDFKWGLGARAIIYNWDNTVLTLSGDYSRMKPKIERLSLAGTSAEQPNVKARVRDWGVGLAVSHQLDMVTPYIGVKFGDAKVKYNQSVPDGGSSFAINLRELEARTNVGLVLGCSVLADKKFNVNLEGRLIDENAASVSADLRF